MIYLKTKKKLTNVMDIIKELYSDIYYEDGDIMARSVTTYKDESCTKVECFSGRWRSIDALIEICKTYLPDITEKEIFTDLFNTEIVTDDGHTLYISLVNCSDIRRPTFYFSRFNDIIDIEWLNFSCNRSDWTWTKAMREAGFKSETELNIHLGLE